MLEAKNIQAGRYNRTEHQDIGPGNYCHLLDDKDAKKKKHTEDKVVYSTNGKKIG